VYDDRLWRYALLHRDPGRLAEWLRHQDDLLRRAGAALEVPPGLTAGGAVGVDPVARGWYQHLEYAPLVNARAHQLGARRRILNDALAQQYRSFLDVVAHQLRAGPADLLAAATYLLEMDRIDDALAILARVDRSGVSTRLQHDYLAAYCACSQGDVDRARRLAGAWLDHPVDRWRDRFAALVASLEEPVPHAEAAPIDPHSRDQQMAASAAREPVLAVSVSGRDVVLRHENLRACELLFHRMDVELAFSRQPFVQADADRFALVEPRDRLEVALEGSRTAVPLPAELLGANLVIEAVARGLRRAVVHYAHDLGLQLTEAYGQIRVVRASTGRPVAAAYVKVYGRQGSGRVSFFKDGYTDLRGRFDYATLSTDELDRVERLALLVVSGDAGAAIVEARPPAR
jgi:hypothetical protein